MSTAEIRELRLISVDGRPIPCDFRDGDQWVEVIGGTLRGSATGKACTVTIEFDIGFPRVSTPEPCTIDDDEITSDLELTIEPSGARNEKGEPIPRPRGTHTYRFQR